jgi:cobalamin 5'-phosphate synthase/cobalamin synthase
VRALLTAFAFLTRIPVPGAASFDGDDVARSAEWFPLVGMVLGGMYSVAALVFRNHLPSLVCAALLILLDVLLTGALHFDGLADTADGFGGGKSIEDKLRIMRDHVIGSYGGVALALVVVLKVSAYSVILKQGDWLKVLVLIPGLGRWSILLMTAALPYARQSPSAIQGMGRRSLVFGSVLMLAGTGVALSMRGWIAMAVVMAVSAGFGLYCKRQIRGITGDTLGANLQLCESAALLVFLWN